MSKNIRTQIGKVVGKTLNSYHARVKPIIDDIKFKESYQGRIIDCMVGEIDDNYIETPATDNPIVKLEHSREGIVKVPSIKGKTILVDSDGNETDTPAEGCSLRSVGEDEDNKLIILSKNKNLFDNQFAHGYIGDSDGNLRPYPSMGKSSLNYIPINYSTTYTVYYECDITVGLGIYFYDKDYNYIGKEGLGYSKSGRKVFSSNTAKYIKLRLYNPNGDFIEDSFKNIKIVTLTLGEIALTEYIPHKSHKTEILLDEPLRSLPNGICDEIVDNQLIRRVGKVVLNGSESWKKGDGGEFYVYGKMLDILVDMAHDLSKYGETIFCNIYKQRKVNQESERIKQISIYNHGGTILGQIRIIEPSCETVEDFKSYVSTNPIEVFYPINPIIEELPNGITLQGFDDTTMYIENSITPTVQYGYNALIPYKEELLTQKEEVETNTLDIEQNIIPYLMDMEFNLMLMEDNQ